MQVALGRTESEAIRDDIHKLSRRIRGYCGLLATNLSREDVETFFIENEEDAFAKAGKVSTKTIELQEGSLRGPDGILLSHTLEPTLRQCGLLTKLNKGVIELVADAKICDEGKILSIDQARLLKIFGFRMARFRLWLDSCWSNDTFEKICVESDDEKDGEDGEDEEDEDL